MTSNVHRFCLQAFIIQSLSCIVMDVSCVGLASYAATPYAMATSYTVAPYTTPMMPNMVSSGAAAYATTPCTTAPFVATPCTTIASPLTTPFTTAQLAAPISTRPTCSRVTPTLAASIGGGLTITSASPVVPTGVSLLSENSIGGGVAIAGEIPFLSAVTLEGTLPTIGSGTVTYKCGNGGVRMLAEDFRNGCNGCIGRGCGVLDYDGYAFPTSYGRNDYANMGCGYDRFAPGCGAGYNNYNGFRAMF